MEYRIAKDVSDVPSGRRVRSTCCVILRLRVRVPVHGRLLPPAVIVAHSLSSAVVGERLKSTVKSLATFVGYSRLVGLGSAELSSVAVDQNTCPRYGFEFASEPKPTASDNFGGHVL